MAFNLIVVPLNPESPDWNLKATFCSATTQLMSRQGVHSGRKLEGRHSAPLPRNQAYKQHAALNSLKFYTPVLPHNLPAKKRLSIRKCIYLHARKKPQHHKMHISTQQKEELASKFAKSAHIHTEGRRPCIISHRERIGSVINSSNIWPGNAGQSLTDAIELSFWNRVFPLRDWILKDKYRTVYWISPLLRISPASNGSLPSILLW